MITPQKLTRDETIKAALLENLKPGVQLIPELAQYANHLIIVEDDNDRIGIREGNYSKAGWAREELFYVEEEGRIIGDIAWEFKNFTDITAIPCNDNYLIVEGGGFYFSGDSGRVDPGGITITAFHTAQPNHYPRQWMGLEKGETRYIHAPPSRLLCIQQCLRRHTGKYPRNALGEKSRRKRQSARCGHLWHWEVRGCSLHLSQHHSRRRLGCMGVFGTNLNKNFRIENCHLNRIDVHFHCWNLYISNCTIGFKGIALTGGGEW